MQNSDCESLCAKCLNGLDLAMHLARSTTVSSRNQRHSHQSNTMRPASSRKALDAAMNLPPRKRAELFCTRLAFEFPGSREAAVGLSATGHNRSPFGGNNRSPFGGNNRSSEPQ